MIHVSCFPCRMKSLILIAITVFIHTYNTQASGGNCSNTPWELTNTYLNLLAFTKVPNSQEVSVGTEAVFTCRYATASSIQWRVNGNFVGRNPPIDITPGITRTENGTLVDTLTIIAQEKYNGTVVVCVALFDDGRPNEESIPATLSGMHIVMYTIMAKSVHKVSPK